MRSPGQPEASRYPLVSWWSVGGQWGTPWAQGPTPAWPQSPCRHSINRSLRAGKKQSTLIRYQKNSLLLFIGTPGIIVFQLHLGQSGVDFSLLLIRNSRRVEMVANQSLRMRKHLGVGGDFPIRKGRTRASPVMWFLRENGANMSQNCQVCLRVGFCWGINPGNVSRMLKSPCNSYGSKKAGR